MISSLELARLCGCSQGTVDRALHGRPGIAEATRDRILAVAAEHGYRPNPAAREMMGHATSALVAAVTNESWQQTPFFIDLLAEVHRHLRAEGLRLIVCFAGDAADQRQAIDDLIARRVRGMVLVHPPADLGLHPGAGFPLVALVHPLPGIPSPMPDEHEMGAAVARHLIALGHRHLLWVGYDEPDNTVVGARRDGFCAAARAAKVTVETSNDPAVAVTTSATGVGCHHDPLARRVLDRCTAGGRLVPDTLSVVGIDGTGADDGLTTLCYPMREVAAAVVAIIQGRRFAAIPVGTIRPGRTAIAASR